MSEDKRQNFIEKEHDCDEEQNDNLEVGTTASDNTVQVPDISSEIIDRTQQNNATESIEVDPNDVISIEELSHEPLNESFGENSECEVIYEFPSDDESKNGSRPAEVYELYSHANLQPSNYNQYRTITQTKEQNATTIEEFDTGNLNVEDTDDTCAAGTSRETERKRKKGSISSIQNKRHKEVESSSYPIIEENSEGSDNTSDEFADVEDNLKDSSSFDRSDRSSSDEKVKQIPVQELDFQFSNVRQNGNKSMKVSHEQSSSGSQSFKYVDKIAEKSPFPSSLKGETLPLFKISDENKDKFELSMPTILEVRESESDEQISQPGQCKTAPLKLKTKVRKRKDRCNVCNVRLGLCAIQCRCGGYYCAVHRYDREHNCTYDYKSVGAAEIKKNNPKIVAEKVRKL